MGAGSEIIWARQTTRTLIRGELACSVLDWERLKDCVTSNVTCSDGCCSKERFEMKDSDSVLSGGYCRVSLELVVVVVFVLLFPV